MMLAYFVILSKAVASDEFYLRPVRHDRVRTTFRVQLSACIFDALCDVRRRIIYPVALKRSMDLLRLEATLVRMVQQGEERHEARLVAPLTTAGVIVHRIECSFLKAVWTADEHRATVIIAWRRRITTSRCMRLQLY